MFAGARNKLFDGGGRRDGIEGSSVVALVEFRADVLKEVDEIGFAPNTFRLETIGVDGKDVACVTGGGDKAGVVA